MRRTTRAQGVLVPSIAFLDEPERWGPVPFVDRLGTPPAGVVTAVDGDGVFRFAA